MTEKPSYEELEQRVRKLEQVEWERQKTEEELAQIFSMSIDMICVADIDTATFLKVNAAFTETLGFAEKELLSKPFFEFIHPEDIASTRSIVEDKLASGEKVINFENRYRCKNGTYKWLSWVSHPIPDIGKTYAVARDITEWKTAEKKHRYYKELLEATGHLARVGGWELDANTLEVTWTEETYRIHEIPLDYKPPLKDAIGFFHPDDRGRLRDAIQRALKNGEPYDLELRFTTAKGNRRWARTKCQPDIADGKTVRLKGTFQDITDRKNAEEALRESELRHRSVLDTINEGVILQSASGEIVTWNKGAETVFGISAQNVIGRKSADEAWPTIHEDGTKYEGKDHPSLKTLQTGIPLHREIMGVLHPDGQVRWISINTNPLFQADENKPYAVVISFTDITEIKKEKDQTKMFLDATTDGIWTWNFKTNALFFSPKYYEMLGYAPNAFPADYDHWLDMIHPDDRKPALDAANAYLVTKPDNYENEFRLRTANGDYRWIRARAKVVERDADGEAVLMVGHHEDITERKNAELALRESEEKFSKAFNDSPVLQAITSIDDGRFIDVNDAFVRITGYTRERAIGSTSTDIGFIKSEERDRILKMLAQRGHVKDIEIEARKFDDTRITCLYSCETVEIRGKRRLLSTAIDITEEKKIEQELNENRERFERMLSVVPDMISIHDLDMNILYSNWQGFASVPEDKRVLNTKCYKTYRGLDHICPDCRAKQVVEIKKPFQSEEQLPDGRWIDLRVMPIDDDDGNLDMFLEWVRDITQSKSQEMELQSQKRLIEGVLDSIKDVIGIQLKDHTVLKYNRAGYELLGLTEEEAKNRKCYELIGRSTPCDPCATRAAIQTKQIETIEKFVPELGMHFLCTSNPILNEHGEISYIIEQLTDITELKKKDEIILQSQKMESVGRLAGGVAHDYNNMLSVILGHTEMLIDSVDANDKFHESFVEIQAAAMRSADITRQLLAFARRQTIAPKRLDLNEVVGGMLKMLNRLIGEDIDLAWIPGKALWPVKLDPSQVDQIMANLCVNSRDAISDVGRITIETSNTRIDGEYFDGHPDAVEGEYVLLTVSDDGHGMDSETLQNIFDPFFTTKAEGLGTGLGLATVYGIVKQNEGFINVYSEPRKGTTFRIYLPRDKSEHDRKTVDETDEMPLSRGETVLIVEDEASILNMGKKMLQRLGYSVLSADSPKEALDQAERHRGEIDVLLTDVVMPEMSGRDLSETLSERYPDIKTLYMSGYTANVIAHRGVLDEGLQFIQKPFSRKGLAVKLREVLDNVAESYPNDFENS